VQATADPPPTVILPAGTHDRVSRGRLAGLVALMAATVGLAVPALLLLPLAAIGALITSRHMDSLNTGQAWLLVAMGLVTMALATGSGLTLRRYARNLPPDPRRRLPAIALGTVLGLFLCPVVIAGLGSVGAAFAKPIADRSLRAAGFCGPSRSCAHQVAAAAHLTVLVPAIGSGWTLDDVNRLGTTYVSVFVQHGPDRCGITSSRTPLRPPAVASLGAGAHRTDVPVRGHAGVRTDIPHLVNGNVAEPKEWELRWVEGNAQHVLCPATVDAASLLSALQPA
jgi:hypothetical protein